MHEFMELLEDCEGLGHTDCPIFQLDIKKTIEGKEICAISCSDGCGGGAGRVSGEDMFSKR